MNIRNVEVTKNQNETNISLIRRFSKRLQEARILKQARGARFFERSKSKLKKKERALKRISKKAEYDRLRKLGKI